MRYEIKYAIDQLDAPSIEASIMMHPASFRQAFPDRIVNNIYMDTPDLHCFYQNIEGVPRRKKMRLRWYGPNELPTEHTILELKNKNAELGWKDTFAIENQTIHSRDQLLAVLSSLAVDSDNMIPILHNSYHRKYYVSSDGLFRITIDTEQSFKIPFSNMPSLPIVRYPNIVELKYDEKYADRSKDIMDYLPFRQSKNSKYTNGVTELYF